MAKLTHEVTTVLLKFQYSSAAKSEGQKFTKLQCKWKQDIVDLEEVGALQSLNNLMIEDIAQKLPGTFLRERYVKLREALTPTGKSSLEIFTAYMSQKHDWQRSIRPLDAPEEPENSTPVLGGSAKVGWARASMKIMWILYPSCKGQYSFKASGGETLYRTRLGGSPSYPPPPLMQNLIENYFCFLPQVKVPISCSDNTFCTFSTNLHHEG